MSKFKEKILLYKLSLKDEKGFIEVYDLYVEKIYRFIFFKISNHEEAEDLTSEVFIKAWQYAQENKEIKAIPSFLYAIARNKVIDLYRKRSKGKTVALDENIDTLKDGKYDIARKIDDDLGIEAISVFLNKLKAEYREALLLRYVDDFSIAEISKILGKKKGTVRVLIHRALEALREIMGE
ncbi:MAG: RNA polymerase sigma factor [bacterium]